MYENYINFFTGEKLPPVLEEKEEQKLLQLLDEGDEEAKDLLIRHNLRLVVFIAKKFENTGIETEELVSIGTIGLIKGVSTFKIDKNIKLATYVSRCIENEILMFLRRNLKHSQVQSLEEPLSVDWDGNELHLEDILPDENADFEEEIVNRKYNAKMQAAMQEILSDREYTIITKLYGFDGKRQTQREVAKTLGLSQSYISRIEKKVLRKLREKLDGNISEIEEYQEKSRGFNVRQIHPDLNLPVFRSLLALFPKYERNFYASYRGIELKEKTVYAKTFGGGVPNFTESVIKEIENVLYELFIYYQEMQKKNGLNDKSAINETAGYARKHSLRFRYPEQTAKEIRSAVRSLNSTNQEAIVSFYGEDISLFTYFLEEQNIDSKPLHALDHKLNKSTRKKVAKENSKTLEVPENAKERVRSSSNKITSPTTLVETPSSEVSLVEESATAIEATEKQKMEVEKVSENKNEIQAETKSIIETYSKEDLMYALPFLSNIYKNCIYLKHGRNLDEDVAWDTMKYRNKTTLLYHKENYQKCYAYIDKILQKREASKTLLKSKNGRESILQAKTPLLVKTPVPQKSISKNRKKKSSKNILIEVDREDLLQIVPLLSETQRKVVYLRHGENLDTVIEWPPIPEGKSRSFYYANYCSACYRIHSLLRKKEKDPEAFAEESKKTNKEIKLDEKKSIIEMYSNEELMYALPLLASQFQTCIYLKHGKDLKEDIPWENLNCEEEAIPYHKENYSKCFKNIDRLLSEREVYKVNSKNMFLKKLSNLEENIVQKTIQTLPKEEQAVIYLKHGRDLTEYNFLPQTSNCLETYKVAIEHLKEKLANIEQQAETGKQKRKSKFKNILEEVEQADLLKVLPMLNEQQRKIIYLRHGKNLDTVIEWPPVPKDKGKTYYFYSYYNACNRIHFLIDCKLKKEQSKEINKEHISRILASINNWKTLKEQKEELIKEKANNLKIYLYNIFYKLYGTIINEQTLINMIEVSVTECNIEEEKNIEYVCQLKVETAILVFLANKYKENPDSEEALNILIQINAIFVEEMKTKYPHMKAAKIEKAIESILNTYTEEKVFSIELMKKLLK